MTCNSAACTVGAVVAATVPPMNANVESFSKNDFMDDRKKWMSR
ncbi:hypothetical protein BSU04_40030 [Caballeronia sordidicola]|uniref:Uncharacterized protein n=1 Tax=Caballeronia sordidicola TaxID=196367 RepID=A0A226WPU6_CABSO|nr:hypothetical protein BSU04_40030 [Caballeronia sordidicola]